jgi:hypothetical protein
MVKSAEDIHLVVANFWDCADDIHLVFKNFEFLRKIGRDL